MSIAPDNVRITITVPRPLMQSLREEDKDISRFFVEAAQEKRAQEQWNKAFEHFQTLPPTFIEIEDPVKWVEELRAEDEERLHRLGI